MCGSVWLSGSLGDESGAPCMQRRGQPAGHVRSPVCLAVRGPSHLSAWPQLDGMCVLLAPESSGSVHQGPATAGCPAGPEPGAADQSLVRVSRNLGSKESVWKPLHDTVELRRDLSEPGLGGGSRWPWPSWRGKPGSQLSPSLPVVAAESEQVPHGFLPRPCSLALRWDPSAQVGGEGAGKEEKVDHPQPVTWARPWTS